MYGIRGIAVYADGLRAVVSDCGKASKSSDARDKYFLSAASEFDDSPAKAFRSELPALEAARAALAASVAELGDRGSTQRWRKDARRSGAGKNGRA